MSKLAQLKAGKQAIKSFPFPGRPTELVHIRVLTCAEIEAATRAALGRFKDFPMDNMFIAEAYTEELSIQVLSHALIDEHGSAFANNADEIRACLTQAEKAYLVAAYNDWQAECSPSLDTLSEDQAQEVLDAVKKFGEKALSDLSTSSLKRLITTLVSRPSK